MPPSQKSFQRLSILFFNSPVIIALLYSYIKNCAKHFPQLAAFALPQKCPLFALCLFSLLLYQRIHKKRPLLPYGESDLRLYSLCYSRGARILLPTSVCASCLNYWDKSHQYSKGLFWAVRSMYEPSRLYRIWSKLIAIFLSFLLT